MDENSFTKLNEKLKFIQKRINEVTIKLSDSFSLLDVKLNENLQQEVIENILQDRRDFLLKQLNHKRDDCLNQIDNLHNNIFAKSGVQFFNLKLNFANNYIKTRYVNKKISKIKNTFVVFKSSSVNFEAEELFGQLDFSRPFDSLEAFKYVQLLSGYLLNNSLIHKIDHEHFKLKHNVSKCNAFFQLSYDRFFYFTTKSLTRCEMFITNNKFELVCSKSFNGYFLNLRTRYEKEKIYVFYTAANCFGILGSLYVCKIYDTSLSLLKKILICRGDRIGAIKSITVHNDDICAQFRNNVSFYDGYKLRADKTETFSFHFSTSMSRKYLLGIGIIISINTKNL
jgi:hypothetical protein